MKPSEQVRRASTWRVPAILVTLLALVLAAAFVPSTARAAQPEFSSWDDLTGKRFGLLTGAPFEELVREKNPNVAEVLYFPATSDMLVALHTGKVDAISCNQAVAQLAISRNDDLTLFPDNLYDAEQGAVFAKGSPLSEPWTAVIERMKDDGTADALWAKWTSGDESQKTVPSQDWPGSNGTLRVAACATMEPCSYMNDDGLVGYDIETLLVAAKELDVHLEFIPMEFAEILASVESKKADIGCGSIFVTEERQQAMDFAIEHANSMVVLVRMSGSATPARVPEYQTIAELAGKRVGVPAGGVFDALVKGNTEGIDDYSYFTTYADMVSALKSNKVDAIAMDEPVANLAVSRNTGVTILPEPLVEDDYGFALPKGSDLTDRLNPIIEGFRADGTLDALKEKWCGPDEATKTMPEQDWDTSAGTIKLAAVNDSEPMSYLRDQEVVGYEVELMMLCARELHMGVEVDQMPLDALLAAAQTGKADAACSSLSITDERKQVMDMTVPTYYGACTFVVRDVGETAEPSFFTSVAASFERTFITENRWKLILSGLGVTLCISLASGALGTALGFATVLLRRGGNRAAGVIVGAFEGLMSRLPIVVVLMVFFYVIFGSIDIPGMVVAIIVFTLAFGASAGAIMWNAVRAVDVGQSEASLALGFNDNETFFGVVLPQAARNFLPLLQGQFVSLIKDTAVVGYIAIIDLTRSSDLIRSRTMEAFFPLFATAAIYFALCCLMAWALGCIIKRLDFEQRPRTIKGVEL